MASRWCAAARWKSSRAGHAAVACCVNFPTSQRRSPAIARRTISARGCCGCRIPISRCQPELRKPVIYGHFCTALPQRRMLELAPQRLEIQSGPCLFQCPLYPQFLFTESKSDHRSAELPQQEQQSGEDYMAGRLQPGDGALRHPRPDRDFCSGFSGAASMWSSGLTTIIRLRNAVDRQPLKTMCV